MSEPAAGLWYRRHSLTSAYGHHRYAVLFYSLLLTLVAAPLLKALALNVKFVTFFLAANLMAAIGPVGASCRRRLLLGIVVIAWLIEIVADRLGYAEVAEVSLVAWTAVAVLAAASAMRCAFRATSVSSEHLYAALSAYLLAGVFFGVFYWILERTWPGSLIVADHAIGGGFRVVNGIYFSFITLATVGYGDVLPRSELAQGCAMLEAVGGQFYIAVMVARLVSLYTVTDRRTQAVLKENDA